MDCDVERSMVTYLFGGCLMEKLAYDKYAREEPTNYIDVLKEVAQYLDETDELLRMLVTNPEAMRRAVEQSDKSKLLRLWSGTDMQQDLRNLADKLADQKNMDYNIEGR